MTEDYDPLQIGAYAALEGDLGDSLCGHLGFHTPVSPQEPFSDDEPGGNECSYGGFATRPYSVVYEVGSL